MEVQVLIAYADGHFALEERMALSMSAQLLEDPEQILKRIDQLIDAIESEGLTLVRERVLAELGGRLAALNLLDEEGALRAQFAEAFLYEMVQIITADQVVASGERSFALEYLNPVLLLPEEKVTELLDRADDALARTLRYVEIAFELYVLWVDAGERTAADEADLPSKEEDGFLSAVSRLVVGHDLVSGSVLGYFLAALGGMSVTESYMRHCEHLAQLAQSTRERRAAVGVEAFVSALGTELEQRVEAGDELAFSFVSTHVTSTLGLYAYTDEGQRALFDNHIAPTLRIGLEGLRESARNMARFNPTLYRNLTGDLIGEVPPERARWWDNWM